MKAITLLASTIALTAVAAQSNEGRLYYTEPTGATVWTSGEKHTVSWSNVCGDKNKSKLDVVLYKGVGEKGGSEQVRVPGLDSIGYVDCKKKNEATITLPAGLTSGENYSIHVNTVPLQSYSAQFTIKGVDPAPSSPAPSSTPGTPGNPGTPGTPGNGTEPTGAPGNTTGTATATVTGTATATVSTSTLAPTAPADTENAAGSLKAFGSTAALLVATVGAYFF
ncbi:hypothetical protein BG011_001715 [Mortierella polycephala]|uniref:Yeast cell wall synthesis Kre9/Knh1-like N-terminal domain-containing protein n=1 Tax=Mortierella polycephala TaxID=41804 RepID=A0A9P6U5J7_9FUNG|nr:hypothetical protein BG011_001715 [Mortierella polycephala]